MVGGLHILVRARPGSVTGVLKGKWDGPLRSCPAGDKMMQRERWVRASTAGANELVSADH